MLRRTTKGSQATIDAGHSWLTTHQVLMKTLGRAGEGQRIGVEQASHAPHAISGTGRV